MPKSAKLNVTIIEANAIPPSVDGFYPIGQLCELFDLTARSIRFYCDLGLITAVSDAGERRVFNRHNARRLSLIQKAKFFGFTLREIESLISDKVPGIAGPALVIPVERLRSEIATLERKQAILVEQLQSLRQHQRSKAMEPQRAGIGA